MKYLNPVQHIENIRVPLLTLNCRMHRITFHVRVTTLLKVVRGYLKRCLLHRINKHCNHTFGCNLVHRKYQKIRTPQKPYCGADKSSHKCTLLSHCFHPLLQFFTSSNMTHHLAWQDCTHISCKRITYDCNTVAKRDYLESEERTGVARIFDWGGPNHNSPAMTSSKVFIRGSFYGAKLS